jgi:hypothetical protein
VLYCPATPGPIVGTINICVPNGTAGSVPVVTSITYNSITQAPNSTGSCGAAAAASPAFVATFTCAGVESGQAIDAPVTVNYVAGYTLAAGPAAFMTAATPGFVPGNQVYAVIATREDNVGPRTHTPVYVNAGIGGWHGAGSAGVAVPTTAAGGTAVIPGTSYSITSTDFGVGVTDVPTMSEMSGTGFTINNGQTTLAVFGPAPSALETVTPAPYFLRGNAVADILGNPGVATAAAGITACGGGVPTGSTSVCAHSSVFGVDLIVLDAQYGDRANSASVGVVWQGLNNQIYTANATTGGVSPGVGATGIAVTDWDIAGGPDGAAENILVDAIDSRSGLNNATALTQKIHRHNAGVSTNCLAFGTYLIGPPILVDNYVQSAPQSLDCGLAAGARVGEYTWAGYVSDRAGNARLITSGSTPPMVGTVNFLRVAIDELAPNITGIGFQTALYTGGQPATYSFSANDDLELWQGQVTLTYGGHAVVTFPYGATAYTSPSFGTPFDGSFVNVLNGAALTIGYYINQYDFASVAAFVPGAAPSGNVMLAGGAAAFTSGGVNTGVTANIRDVAAQQAAVPLVAPVLLTQLAVRAGAPAYNWNGVPANPTTGMIDFRIIAHSGTHVITVQDAAPSSTSVAFCDRVDIYEVVEAGGDAIVAGMAANNALIGDDVGDALVYRSTVTAVPVPGAIPDNGFQRFLNYVSAAHTNVGTGLYAGVCVKNGSALFSPIG